LRSLIVIPARGGSKGIPRKNIKMLNGKPLIQYTIEAARQVFDDENICISTEDLEIKSIVENIGLKVPFLRPDYLATDESTSEDVLNHALTFYNGNGKQFDTVVLLQPTSPFRNGKQIQEAVFNFTSDLDMVVSVKETKSNPYYVLFEEDLDGFLNKSKKASFTKRQDCPKVYELNGAIYVINTQSLQTNNIVNFKKVRKYVMDEMSSLDIDDNFDWLMAEMMFKNENS
jgi:N-acylneuraminate cytidylyltransferase